jgi:hypothetical protein
VRLNKRDKTSAFVPIPDEWEYPDNEAIDVAVMPFAPDRKVFDFFPLPTSLFALSSVAYPNPVRIGIGDELIMVGLFHKHSGRTRNIPIVRAGIIAATPDEPFEQLIGEGDGAHFLFYDAYLAEVRSIGGLSGSPVFIIYPPGRLPADVLEEGAEKDDHRFQLLGLIRGHWNVDEEETADDNVREELETFNSGIAKVTPADDAWEILKGAKLMKERRERSRQFEKKNEETLDSAPLPKPTEEATITREGFEETFRRASRRTSSQPESESDET